MKQLRSVKPAVAAAAQDPPAPWTGGGPNGAAHKVTGAHSEVNLATAGQGRSDEIRSWAPAGKLAVGPHLADELWEQWRDYRKQLRKCQKKFNIENVHELRVQTRRLMAKLALIRNILAEPKIDKARRMLKARLAVLGDLRDTHVQIVYLNHNIHRFPGLLCFRDYLARRERCLTKPTFKKTKRFRTAKLGRWICALRKALCKNARVAEAQQALALAVWGASGQAFEQVVERRREIAPDDLKSIHRTRVAFKKFRYTVECLPVDVYRPSEHTIDRLAAYQRKMGDIQDVQVMLTRIAQFLQEHQKATDDLRPFREYLVRRRTRLVRTYLASADALLQFWPPRLERPKAP